ncbi:MAG: sugar transferase [Anaerolineae bacterium]
MQTQSARCTPIEATGQGRGAYLARKRGVDLALGGLLLALASPLLLLIALAIRLDSQGPVLLRQTRVGRRGCLFTCYKFRTMVSNADPELHRRYMRAFIHNQVPASAALTGDAAAFKLVNDPRVTRVGRVLRRTSLDELPQLLNVLRGDMSLVGPRPALPYEVAEYEAWHCHRLEALPGLTGWWQVYGRSRVSFDEMVRMDLEYIAHQSLALDMKLIMLTVPVVLLRRGAR